MVAAPDLVGTGEVGPGRFRGDAYDYGVGIGAYNLWWGANQVGRSLVGIRAGDVARVVDFLEAREDVHPGRVGGVAHGTMGPVLLHAAAFVEGLAGVAVTGSPASYAGIAVNRYYRPELIHGTVPGALIAYDLPDLVATLTPRSVMVLDAVDHWGRVVERDMLLAQYDVAVRSHRGSVAPAGFVVGETQTGDATMDAIASLARERAAPPTSRRGGGGMTGGPGRRLRAVVTTGLGVALALAAGCDDDGVGPGAEAEVTVLTWNLYLGSALASSLAGSDVEDLPDVVAALWATIEGTDFPERAQAIADEIVDVDPDLIGLQEATLYRRQSPGDVPERESRGGRGGGLRFPRDPPGRAGRSRR